MTVRGLNDAVIVDGDNKATAADGTHFGKTPQGGASETRTFTVTNDGDAALNLGSLKLPTGFTLADGLDGALLPGASDTFTVRMDVDEIGTRSGQLSFTTNDPDEAMYNFRLLGKVLPHAGRSGLTVTGLNGVEILDGGNKATMADGTNFGKTGLGSSPLVRTFTVTNDGGDGLTLNAVSVPVGFTLIEGLAGSLAVGESDTFTVRLDADIAGTKSGHLSFMTNGSDDRVFNFRILGKVL